MIMVVMIMVESSVMMTRLMVDDHDDNQDHGWGDDDQTRIMVGEGVSAFLNPVRATDNIWASPDRLQQFHNDDEDDEDAGDADEDDDDKEDEDDEDEEGCWKMVWWWL